MQKRMWTTVGLITLSLAVASTAMAQSGKSTTNQGGTPNGKPFQQIQSQFAAVDEQLNLMNQQIQALQTQITTVESTLQAQITTINGTLSSLQTQITAIDGTLTSLQTQITDAAAATSSLEARVTANEAAIAALNTAVSSLQAQLVAAQALIDGNTGDITALQAQVTSIQSLINAHNSQILALQQQTAQMNQFLGNLANGNCQSGQAIQDIAPGGFIACTQAGGGNLQTLTNTAGFYLNFGNNYASVGCPSGYSATGSGFSFPSYYESTAVVTYVGYNYYSNPVTHTEYYYDGWYGSNYYYYTTYDTYTIPYSSTTYMNTSPIAVTQKATSGNYASLQAQYTPRNSYGGYYYQVSVTCAKIQ